MRQVPDFTSNIQPCHGQVSRVPASRPSLSGPPWCAHSSLHAKTSSLTRASTTRSEEHTSELQSPCNLVCRLLLEKKKPRLTCSLTSSCSCRSVRWPLS